MSRVFTAKTTELLELQALRRFLLVFGSDVIAVFAIATLQSDIVSHNFPGVRGQVSGVSQRRSLKPDTWNLEPIQQCPRWSRRRPCALPRGSRSAAPSPSRSA